ncbi:TetR/AcrR family transcriptional regulator [Spongiactinospora rosea]|uniref:TetR/AcrR family transcriptional regulator n=1 Tax=Spongiactinospora rosea TaxID=2248750 RepID=A0A366M5R0_9ACTN|nr:TetR/AcrR family transcriptional regulator [Spongiactinospora rosea]RBQ20772.1 TetR/AcrR family transcriptional regulator [Spongiactinospora rosea]
MTETSKRRRPRADARRNVERLLAVADGAFREHGVDASLGQIARAAGVAIGTVYAHFATRRALIAALLRERHEALFALGEDLLDRHDPAEALSTWVRECVRNAATYRGLAAVLAAGLDDEASELHESCERMADLTDRVTAAARAAGLLRPEVRADDLTALMGAAAWTRETSGVEQGDRLIRFTLDGFRPPSTT